MSKRAVFGSAIVTLLVIISSIYAYNTFAKTDVEDKPTPGATSITVIKQKPIQLDALKIESLVNRQRESLGLPLLAHSDELTVSACAKADDMIAKNYWSHVAPDGTEPWHFINEAKYFYVKAGENLAYNNLNESALVINWMNSPGHRATIVDDYEDFGTCARTSENYQGRSTNVFVQHFGTRQ